MAKLPEKERGKKENGSPCTYGEAARERVREKEREKGRERERSLCKIRHLSPCVIASYWLADVSHKSSFWAISRWHKQATTTTTAAASFAGRIMHSHRSHTELTTWLPHGALPSSRRRTMKTFVRVHASPYEPRALRQLWRADDLNE